MDGFILYHRSSIKHPLRSKPAVWSYWIHCLESAAWVDHKVWWNNQEYLLERGSFISSSARDQIQLGLSRQELRTAQKHLERCGMITIDATNSGTLIKVCNYSVYQNPNGKANQQTNQESTSDQPTANQRPTSDQPQHKERNKIKERKKGKKITTEEPKYSDAFESFWKAYPKKENKAEAWELYQSILDAVAEGHSKTEVENNLNEFAQRYAKEYRGNRKQYAQKAKYILRNMEWLNWMNDNQPEPEASSEQPRQEDQSSKQRGCSSFQFYRTIIRQSLPDLNLEEIQQHWNQFHHFKTVIENAADHQRTATR